MSDTSNYLRDALADHIFGGVPYTPPADFYLALFSVAPTASGGGTEVAGGGYARPVITWESTGEPGEYENEMVQIEDMPEVDVVAIGVMDSLSGGNLLFFKSDFGTLSFLSGDTYAALAGSITAKFL